MTLDLTQVSILFFSLGVLLNLATSFVTWRATQIRAAKLWTISAMLGLFGLGFLVLYMFLHLKFLLILQNLAYSVALAMVPVGVKILRGQRYSARTDIFIISFTLALVAGALWIRDSFAVRVAVGSCLFAYYSFSSAYWLWQSKTSVKAIRFFAVSAWSLYGLVSVIRLVLTLAGVGIDDARPFSGITYLIVFIFGPVCTTGGYTGLVLLVIQKLLDEKREALQAAEKLAEEYRQLSDHDPLTNALNNRSFNRSLDLERARCIREGRSLSIVMADLDHFKDINDTFGHAAGDQTLKQAVSVWRSQLRAPDLLGRVGGEEFVIILPQANLKHATHVAERLRSALQANARLFPREITASFGVIETGHDETTEQILHRVDVAMYAAKQKGRNRVVQG